MEGILPRLISIENLEETRISALERTAHVQMKRKQDYDRKFRRIMESGSKD
jgi:hypothetical protein